MKETAPSAAAVAADAAAVAAATSVFAQLFS